MSAKESNPPKGATAKPEPPPAPAGSVRSEATPPDSDASPHQRFQEAMLAWQAMGEEVVIPLAKEVFGPTAAGMQVTEMTHEAYRGAMDLALDGPPRGLFRWHHDEFNISLWCMAGGPDDGEVGYDWDTQEDAEKKNSEMHKVIAIADYAVYLAKTMDGLRIPCPVKECEGELPLVPDTEFSPTWECSTCGTRLVLTPPDEPYNAAATTNVPIGPS